MSRMCVVVMKFFLNLLSHFNSVLLFLVFLEISFIIFYRKSLRANSRLFEDIREIVSKICGVKYKSKSWETSPPPIHTRN